MRGGICHRSHVTWGSQPSRLALAFSRAAWFLPFNFRAKGHPTSPTGKEMPCKLMQGPDATPKKLEAYRMLSFILTGGAYQSSTMQH